MRDVVEEALKGHDADYVEIRFEDVDTTRIQYRGRDLEDIGRATSFGGNVRALVKGGWGFVSFNDPADLRANVELAVRHARLVGHEQRALAPVAPVVDIVPAVVKKDPAQVPLAMKKRLLDDYNAIIWGMANIQSSTLTYNDTHKKTVYANSEGSYVEQSKIDLGARIAAIARVGAEVQQASLSLGGNGDYGFIEGLHDKVAETARRAVALLSAKPARAGQYTVICDPVLAGVFAHEAFGHLSESDFVYENPQLRDLMVLGKRFGGPHLNIVDGAAVPDLRGSYKYDDEGVPSTRTYLIREGILVGRLHSRETAGKMGERPTGNARATSYSFRPIVRMTNTFIEGGTTSFADMLADVDEGIYAKHWYGGTTSMEMFTFSAGEAYMIRHGRLEERLRGVVLTGNVFSTLANIDAVSDDLRMTEGGGCGKGEQFPLSVSTGAPHIRIRDCVVGGR